jgi:hypothetical protein
MRNRRRPLIRQQEQASRHLTEGIKASPIPRVFALGWLVPVIPS